MPQVKVMIDTKTGVRKYKVEGLMGEGCEDLTRALEQANTVVDKELTQEHCMPAENPDYLEQEE